MPDPTTPASTDGEIRLIVRGDDIGCCHAANEACVQSYREGIMRSVELMPTCAWVPEAIAMLNANPGLDVGVHLMVTSEWDRVKWRPLTHAPSLVDADGFFHPMTAQRPDFPPGTGFLECGWKLEEVERELRAQIELTMRHLKQVSHVSTHMGAPTVTPELREMVRGLTKEYGLEVNMTGVQHAGGLGPDRDFSTREATLAGHLEKLTPGLWIFVDHPGFDVPEMRAMGHRGYEDVALDREGVTRTLCSAKVKAVIARKKIRLMSYADVKHLQP